VDFFEIHLQKMINKLWPGCKVSEMLLVSNNLTKCNISHNNKIAFGNIDSSLGSQGHGRLKMGLKHSLRMWQGMH